jgi:hypothetical protein
MKKTLLISLFSFFILTAFAVRPGLYDFYQDGAGIDDTSQNELRVYPNPTETGRVTLEMNTGEISEIRLINIAGKEVVFRKIDLGTPKYVLLLDNLPNGIYFVRVKSMDNKTVVKKLIVSTH